MNRLNYPIFNLSGNLSQEHRDFYETYGFLHFRNFVSRDKVKCIIAALEEVQQQWLAEDLKQVNGQPIRYGVDVNGERIVQRFCFASLYHAELHELLQDMRFQSLIQLLGIPGRVGEVEKNGMVVNHYINTEDSNYTQLGWHTDAVRDFFYGKKIMPMLNVGLHLDDYPKEKGGLRILPGTHKQKVWSMLFRKKYFFDRKPDPEEVGFDIEAGDLTVHDGRLWHRVEKSSLVGEASRRRVMYIPIVTGKYRPKHMNSAAPVYLKFQNLLK